VEQSVERSVQDSESRERAGRGEFRRFTTLTTRWSDNDAYGHLNNVVYYELFDSAVNAALIDAGLLDVERSPAVGLVVETGCRYFEPLAFPEAVEAGVRVERIGGSSVRYAIAIFRLGAAQAAAQGHFVHVYVDRATRRPVAVPAEVRGFLETLEGSG
jgi:acyl-CoA thioester hydrolase